MKRTAIQAPTAAQLTACATRDAARALLPLTLTRAQLDAVAAEVGLRGTSRHNKAALIELIVHHAVGHRISADAILNSRPDRPIPVAPAPDRAAVTETLASAQVAAAARMRAWTERIARAAAEGTLDPDALRALADAAQALADAARAAIGTGPADALQAIRDLNRPTGWTSITDLRDRLPYASAEQDALMIGLLRDKLVDIMPSGNLKPLTERDRTAALMLGGQWTHVIRVR